MNPPPLRSPIANFFVGLWDLMNFTRRLIFNLVFFGGLLLLAVLFLAGSLLGARNGSACSPIRANPPTRRPNGCWAGS